MFYLPLSSMCKTPKISSRKRGPPPPFFDRIRTFSSWLFLKSEKNQNILYVLCLFFRIDGHWKRSVDIAQQRVPTRCHPSVSTRLREIDSILTLQNRGKTGECHASSIGSDFVDTFDVSNFVFVAPLEFLFNTP